MRAGGMQAEDTRMHLADGTLVKTPSAPCHRDDPSPACAGVPAPPTLATSRDNPQPRLRGGPASRPEGGFSTSCSYAPASTGVSTQRCRNSPPSPSPVATVTANPSHDLVRRHRNKNARTHALESQINSSYTNKNETISTALKSIHGSQPRGH